MPTTKLNEETSNTYAAQLVDEDGTSKALTDVETVLLTVYDSRTQTILREACDALNANDVTITSAGVVTWSIQPYETAYVNQNARPGSTEEHTALFEFSWAATGTDSLSGPYATTADSKAVPVTHASHGLAANEHVVFVGGSNVGGLNLQGSHVITSVVDADTYTINSKIAATSTATGGGVVTAHNNPKVAKHEYKFRVKRLDLT